MVGLPKQPKSPQPMSSQNMTTILGGVSAWAIDVMQDSKAKAKTDKRTLNR